MPSPLRSWRRSRGRALALALVLTASLGLAGPAYAAEGSIDHVERDEGTIKVLYSLPGAGDVTPDLDTLKVSLNDTELSADAELAADATTTLRRTTILAMDVSNSMAQNNRFEEAQQAAKAFLDAAPDDLYVGIVTFAGEVTVAQQPSLDRDESARVIDSLELSKQTRLYDGLLQSVTSVGDEGARSLLVLSDGRDTSDTPIETVTKQIDESKVKVDVVALSLGAEDLALLQQLADAGNGTVISADDPAALTQVFSDEAETLARQILISVTPPGESDVTEGTLAVSVEADGEVYTDTAFITVAAPTAEKPTNTRTQLVPVEPDGFQVSRKPHAAGNHRTRRRVPGSALLGSWRVQS